jgi:hypothetical protein
MNLGNAVESWRFNWGVTLGDSPPAIFSNSLRVMTVLQSADFFAGEAAVLPADVFDAVDVDVGGHTPTIVSTTASSGTSAGGFGLASASFGAGAWCGAGAGVDWVGGVAGVLPGCA